MNRNKIVEAARRVCISIGGVKISYETSERLLEIVIKAGAVVGALVRMMRPAAVISGVVTLTSAAIVYRVWTDGSDLPSGSWIIFLAGFAAAEMTRAFGFWPLPRPDPELLENELGRAKARQIYWRSHAVENLEEIARLDREIARQERLNAAHIEHIRDHARAAGLAINENVLLQKGNFAARAALLKARVYIAAASPRHDDLLAEIDAAIDKLDIHE